MEYELPSKFSGRQFLSTKEIVEITGRSKGLVVEARKRGELRSVRIGARAVAFPVADVIALLSGRGA